MLSKRILKRAALMFVIAAMATGAASKSDAREPHIAPIQSHPHGQTYGEWAADYWQVALETPASVNPITDPTGEHCDQGDMEDVWFLFGSLAPATIERSCEIPVGTALFFPVVTVFYGAFLNDPPGQRTEEFIRGQVDCVEDAASSLRFEFNGAPVQGLDQFFKDSGSFYDVQLPEDNIFGLTEAQIPELLLSPSADAGFYLFLRPLPPGDYDLHWEASTDECFNPDGSPLPVEQNVTYHLTIKPGRRD
jgi:hypothetical protein